MDVGEAIGARRSIRKYEKRSIPSATLSQLLDSARLAPSANNRQEWSIVVVTDAGLLGKLVPVVGDQGFVGDCSAFLVGVAESGASMPAVDIAIALKDALGIPSDRDVPVCMTLGYPEGTPSPTERKTFSDLFHSDRWGSIWP
jgi:hypothetical protein